MPSLRIRLRPKRPERSNTAKQSEQCHAVTSTTNGTLDPSTPMPCMSAAAACMARKRSLMKQDPVSWKAHLVAEAERHRQRRRLRTEEQRAKDRESGCERSRRYYTKCKAEGCKKKIKAPKVLTRAEKLSTRKYNRDAQARCRLNKSSQKIRRDREKDRERKKKKREANKSTPKTVSVRSTPKVTPEPTAKQGFSTRSTRNKAVSRLLSRMPSDSVKFTDIVEGLLQSRKLTPKKISLLQERGLLPDIPDVDLPCRKKLFVHNNSMKNLVWRSIKGHLKRLESCKDDQSRLKRRTLMAALIIEKKYKQMRQLSRELEIRPNYVASIAKKPDQEMLALALRKKRSDTTCLDVIQDIQAFYRSPEISRELPTMKTVVTAKLSKELQQRKVMEVSIAKAYEMFKERNLETVVSESVFHKLRPEDVLLMRRNRLNQCLCETCTDVMLKINALNKAVSGCDHKYIDLKLKDKYDLLMATMCPKSDGQQEYNLKCIHRSCDHCGTKVLAKRFEELIHNHGDRQVSWKKWDTLTYTHNDQKKSKKVLQLKTGTLQDLLKELLRESEELSRHVFVAGWQQRMFTKCTKQVKENEVILVLDFAENYSCLCQDEIQSHHWAINQVTLHPIVAFYPCPEAVEHEPHIVQEAIVCISNDLIHDAHAVHYYTKIALEHLRTRRGLNIEKVKEFTDGCGGQYKSKLPFADISFAQQEFNIKSMERHFFGSRHGKGPSDGVSGVVKSTVRRAVIARTVVVDSAEEMFTFCQKNLTRDSCKTQRRSFLFVKKDVIIRDRPDHSVKASVPGTRLLHAVRGVEPGVIDVRLLSCFCSSCNEDSGEPCENSSHMQPWQRRALRMVNTPLAEVTSDRMADTNMTDNTIVDKENLQEIWKSLTSDETLGTSENENEVHSENGEIEAILVDLGVPADLFNSLDVVETGLSTPDTMVKATSAGDSTDTAIGADDTCQSSKDVSALPEPPCPGQWIAVSVGSSNNSFKDVFFAKILQVDDDLHEIQVHFLKMIGGHFIMDSSASGMSWVDYGDCAAVPTPTTNLGRRACYYFPDGLMERVKAFLLQ